MINGDLLDGDFEAPVASLRSKVALLVVACALAAPASAPGGSGGSSNPLTLLASIATHSTELGGLLDRTNGQLTTIQADLGEVRRVQAQMATLDTQTASLRRSTGSLATRLGDVRLRIVRQGRTLGLVGGQVARLGRRMHGLQTQVAGSLQTTRGTAQSFGSISSRMRGMAGDFDGLLHELGASAPRVSFFSQNRLDRRFPGGDSSRYGALNLGRGTRVMSIMLPMISQLQSGGDLVGNKISQTASNDLVAKLLAASVPDGTNVRSTILPYDGRYGLPPASWFVSHAIAGF